jgi:hypothetical protein
MVQTAKRGGFDVGIQVEITQSWPCRVDLDTSQGKLLTIMAFAVVWQVSETTAASAGRVEVM